MRVKKTLLASSVEKETRSKQENLVRIVLAEERSKPTNRINFLIDWKKEQSLRKIWKLVTLNLAVESAT